MTGYTGTVRCGFSLRDPGQGRLAIEELAQVRCPECNGPARLEVLTINGEPAGQIFCATWKLQRSKCLKPGCKPARISKEELEKLNVTYIAKQGDFLTAQQEEELRRMIASINFNPSQFAIACGWHRTRVHDMLQRKRRVSEADWAQMGSATTQEMLRQKELAAKGPTEATEAATTELVRAGIATEETEARMEVMQLALETLKTTFMEHRDRLADEASAIKARLDSLELVDGQQWERMNEHEERRRKTHEALSDLFVRIVKLEETAGKPQMIDYSRGVGEPLELEFEPPETWCELRQASQESTAELLKAFAGFEHICRKMRAKCPHLFQATVRRASESAF